MSQILCKQFVYGRLVRYASIDETTRSALLCAPEPDSFDRFGQEVAIQRFLRKAYSFDARLVVPDTSERTEGIEYDSFADWEQERIIDYADSYMARKNELPNGAFLPALEERKG